MSDSWQYPLKLCLIKAELDIHYLSLKNRLFVIVLCGFYIKLTGGFLATAKNEVNGENYTS